MKPVVRFAPYKSLNALASQVDFAKLSRVLARFDIDELNSVNNQLLQELDYGEVDGRLKTAAISGEAFGKPCAAICAFRRLETLVGHRERKNHARS